MATPVLELTALSKKTDPSGPDGLRALDLRVMPGEVVAVLGMHAKDRSLLIDLLCGLEEPDHGAALFHGTAIHRQDETKRHALRGRMGVVTDPPVFLKNVRMMENLRLPLRYHSRRDTKSIDARLLELCRLLEIGPFPDVIPSHFDADFLGAAALVRALSVAPDLLVIDRPLESLGGERADRLPRILKPHVLDHGGAALLLTTVPPLARALADRVAVFEEGGIARTEPPRTPGDPPEEKS